MPQKKTIPIKEPSSFRDPSGYVFYSKYNVYRKINEQYKDNYVEFIKSGLSKILIEGKLLLSFTEDNEMNYGYKYLKVAKIPFISYPYEWSFSQLKDAALLTLKIQRMSLEHNMSLKDASAYNIQFLNGRPLLIDLLSFEKYKNNSPWIAYQQFCQHFLGPLLLQSKTDLRLNQLSKIFLDGIPLDLVSKLLPKSSFLNFSILSHIHFHAKNQKAYAGKGDKKLKLVPKISKTMQLGILDNLSKLISNLNHVNAKTEWGDYYTFTNYSESAFKMKKSIIKKMIETANPKNVWDLGGNTGEFSRLASDMSISTVCFDIDPLAVEYNYLNVKKNNEKHIFPLIMDLTNPTPSLGWNFKERKSLLERGPSDLIMALALIHHLSISNNVPFEELAKFFVDLGKYLIIEFVPKTDSKVKILLSSREDIFPDYDEETFEKVFLKYFDILEKKSVKKGSLRKIYLMKKKSKINEKI
ncbi:MAG: SAM-dependent methyltransferase [Candidatus Pacebacteria bacterium CG10_big_fil_rev_8_21_14_0_10_40_26]|nr:MAG: SAM-dependent methyltransferase [Candidatus Pacebacteria bacterium CG10_big_fil_rev_8_21_14_0_10_40_26]